ncbi:hypothetical protein PLEOSDRAFT_1104979 [Pleurotus ostreatus PC15]|uniref:Uncharacterized protein n=1 Tax=Pleurotus ostreatus (strain PC15) TaxID=1137138 RepID=A0A067NK90_PLEO1|nr:hypothetical protein PLEOSDRAFT_1104979 [Pleurotus ostreatus PC15]
MDISIFQVENVLFRIPTGYLKQHSAIFNDMFSLETQPGAGAEGQSDETPIRLDGVSKVDFERFLEVILTAKYTQVEPRKSFGTSHWLSVLKLANLWGFAYLRQTAITKLSSSSSEALRPVFTATEHVDYGRSYKVEQWVKQGYAELVSRREKINKAEAACIGWEAVLKLCHLREDLVGQQGSDANSLGAPAHPTRPRGSIISLKESPALNPAVNTAICQAFSVELQDIRGAAAALSVPAPTINVSLPQVR